MSVKHYCDGCGEQIDRNYISQRLQPELQLGGNRIRLEVIVAVNGTSNAGDLCAYCLRRVFNEGRDTSGRGGWPVPADRPEAPDYEHEHAMGRA